MPLGLESGDDELPIKLLHVSQIFAPRVAEMRAPIRWLPAITPLFQVPRDRVSHQFFTAKSFVVRSYISAVITCGFSYVLEF